MAMSAGGGEDSLTGAIAGGGGASFSDDYQVVGHVRVIDGSAVRGAGYTVSAFGVEAPQGNDIFSNGFEGEPQ